MALPKDAVMLLSYVNTALRDKYSTLEDMAASEGFAPKAVEERLNAIGYSYNSSLNKFV